MFRFRQKLSLFGVARFNCFPYLLFISVAATILVFQVMPAQADAVTDLQATFGTPQTFIANFEATIKDRSDQVIGLLIAATGFSYAVRAFM